VVLLRELNVALQGSELIYLLALGGWLLGSGLGALPLRGAGPGAIRAAFLALALLLPCEALLARALRSLLQATPGAALPLYQQLLCLPLILLPPALLAGMLFRRVAERAAGEGRSLAGSYGVESAGGLLGGALATGMMALGMSNLATAMLAGAMALVAACWPAGGPRPRWLTPGAVIAGLALLAGSSQTTRLDPALTRLEHPALAASRDTPYGRVTVERREQQVAVFLNGALAFESQGAEAEIFVHPAALQLPRPRELLLLGGAAEGLLAEALKHGPERVTVAELDGAFLELVLDQLPVEQAAVFDDPRVQIALGDPRRLLERGARYDLLLVGMPAPDSAAAARYYSAEFFQACSERLRPDGVLALRLPGAENLWTPTLTWRNATVQRALEAAFSDVLVLPGTTNTWIASQAPLLRDAEVLARRMEDRQLQTRLLSAPMLGYLLNNDRTAEIAALLAASPAPANRDAHPSCYQLGLLLWAGRFHPGLAMRDLTGLLGSPWLPVAIPAALLTPLAILVLLARRAARGRRRLLAALAGFTGIVLESTLMLHYQVARGVLWQDLGLLLTVFMAGLSLGALGVDRLARAPGGLSPWRGRALVLGAALAALTTAGLLQLGSTGGLAGTGALLLAAGAGTAALFGLASQLGRPQQSGVVAPLYAADLLGGCLGSLLASLLLLPLLGLPAAALLAALAALAALALVR